MAFFLPLLTSALPGAKSPLRENHAPRGSIKFIFPGSSAMDWKLHSGRVALPGKRRTEISSQDPMQFILSSQFLHVNGAAFLTTFLVPQFFSGVSQSRPRARTLRLAPGGGDFFVEEAGRIFPPPARECLSHHGLWSIMKKVLARKGKKGLTQQRLGINRPGNFLCSMKNFLR